ncbi:MAG: type II toxin-antitoxin system RelE/ParE family toxin [Proteobacteria bacterium]|nr:type II toxin-antitoxin system RelE/ParE family toxin [Pseudomonadota bacterium]
MKLKWSPLAMERVLEIALDKPSAAEKWATDIFKITDNFKHNPKLGRIAPELYDESFRELIQGNYRIVYKIDTQISILAIRHYKQMLTIEDVE